MVFKKLTCRESQAFETTSSASLLDAQRVGPCLTFIHVHGYTLPRDVKRHAMHAALHTALSSDNQLSLQLSPFLYSAADCIHNRSAQKLYGVGSGAVTCSESQGLLRTTQSLLLPPSSSTSSSRRTSWRGSSRAVPKQCCVSHVIPSGDPSRVRKVVMQCGAAWQSCH